MIKLTVSEGANPNYLCKVVEIKNLRKHSNADRLMMFTVDGNDIITSNQTVEGTIGIYFPLESALSVDYLSKNNEFSDANLNADVTKKGYFNSSGRVRATRLRNEKSMGYVSPIDSLSVLVGDEYKDIAKLVGTEFDTINGIRLAKKFVIKQTAKEAGKGDRKAVKSAKVSRLVDNQFRLHYDTAQLAKNLFKLKPESIISLSWKLHGTSFVSSKILCKRKLTWIERIAKYFGVRVKEEEYDNIYSSRKVVKNGFHNANPTHYYGYDLWEDINKRFEANLLDGETIYGEAVGYTKDGGFIQKGYDYKCQPSECKVFIYRITHTSNQGKVIDLPFNMVQERAIQLGAETVPLIYFGRADAFVSNNELPDVRDWQEAILELLKVRYVHDQDCQFCDNKVPAEGVVLRTEGLVPDAYKLKAFRFFEHESKELDKGEANIEDQVEDEDAV